MTRIRTLRDDEREALLDLLDLWPVPDGWQGRDLFRRYLYDDHTFAPENVWVAEDGGRLVGCVQIFPRALRLRDAAVPTGGVGSVFTLPEVRGRGVASALLERSVEAMRGRGFELSLLFAERHRFYGRLGWEVWEKERRLLVRGDGTDTGAGGWRAEPFDAARDLGAVAALHADYSAPLDGTAVRDAQAWETSLRIAGNPNEDFLVARRDGEVVAYVRGIVLSGFPVIAEWGRRPDAAPALAALVAGLLGSRELVAAPALEDAEVLAALAARGVELRSFADRGSMLRCLDAAALARRIGEPRADGESDSAYLRRVLPPERFCYWASDRF